MSQIDTMPDFRALLRQQVGGGGGAATLNESEQNGPQTKPVYPISNDGVPDFRALLRATTAQPPAAVVPAIPATTSAPTAQTAQSPFNAFGQSIQSLPEMGFFEGAARSAVGATGRLIPAASPLLADVRDYTQQVAAPAEGGPGSMVGGIIGSLPALAAGPLAPAIFAGSSAEQSLHEHRNDSEASQIGHAVASGALNALAPVVGGRLLAKPAEALGGRVAGALGETAGRAASGAVEGSGGGSLLAASEQAQNTPMERWQADPVGAATDILKAAGVGAAGGAVVGGVAGAVPRGTRVQAGAEPDPSLAAPASESPSTTIIPSETPAPSPTVARGPELINATEPPITGELPDVQQQQGPALPQQEERSAPAGQGHQGQGQKQEGPGKKSPFGGRRGDQGGAVPDRQGGEGQTQQPDVLTGKTSPPESSTGFGEVGPGFASGATAGMYDMLEAGHRTGKWPIDPKKAGYDVQILEYLRKRGETLDRSEIERIAKESANVQSPQEAKELADDYAGPDHGIKRAKGAASTDAGGIDLPADKTFLSELAENVRKDAEHHGQMGAVHPSARVALLDPETRESIGIKAAGFLGRVAGRAFPRMAHIAPEAADAAVEHASAKSYAIADAQVIGRDVMGRKISSKVARQEFGNLLLEDGLRATRDKFLAEGDKKSADAVGSNVGPGKYFRDEAHVQATLHKPEVRQYIAGDRANGEPVREAGFRSAQGMDATDPLPNLKGPMTGLHISLKQLTPEEAAESKSAVRMGQPQGKEGMIRRMSPFARRRTGTGEFYEGDYLKQLEHSLATNYPIGKLKVFQKSLMDSGNAVEATWAKKPESIKGEPVVSFKVAQGRMAVFDESGAPRHGAGELAEGSKAIPIESKFLFVRESLAKEVRAAAGDLWKPDPTNAFHRFLNTATGLQLTFGLADQASHIKNLLTAFVQAPMLGKNWVERTASTVGGVPRLIVSLKNLGENAIKYAQDDPATLRRYADMTRIGGTRAPKMDLPQGKMIHGFNTLAFVLRKTSEGLAKPIEVFDRAVRLTLDDAYTDAVKRGWAEDSDAARRDFLSNAGQYNKQLQGAAVRFARNSGMGPFATAGTNFTRVAVKNMLPMPGIRAADAAGAAKMTALRVGSMAGLAAQIYFLNWLVSKKTGKPVPPGVPPGAVWLGSNDENDKPRYFDVWDKLTGARRALRAFGLNENLNRVSGTLAGDGQGPQSFVTDSVERQKAMDQMSLDAGAAEAINEWTRPFLGPGPNTAAAVGGVNLSLRNLRGGLQRSSDDAPPGTSQIAENLRSVPRAVFSQMVPSAPEKGQTVAAKAMGAKEGGGLDEAFDIMENQVRPFAWQKGKNPAAVQDAKKIENFSQAKDFVDSIARRARQIADRDARRAFIEREIDKLPEDQRRKAKTDLYLKQRILAK